MDKSEILEPLHACIRELLENDSLGKTHLIEYTDQDVIGVTLLFSHILGNRLVHTLTDERVSIGMSKRLGENYGSEIAILARSMSGVDINEKYRLGDKNT